MQNSAFRPFKAAQAQGLCSSSSVPHQVLPNPSFKRTPNGVAGGEQRSEGVAVKRRGFAPFCACRLARNAAGVHLIQTLGVTIYYLRMSAPEESSAAELQRKLHIDEALAIQLVKGHLETIEEVAYVPLAEFLEVTGLQAADAKALRQIAALYLLNEGLGDEFGPRET
jgi:hypothetical protein